MRNQNSIWHSGLALVLVILCVASARAGDRAPVRVSWGPVHVGPDQELHLNVAYAPPGRSDGASPSPIRIRVQLDLYRPDGLPGLPETARFVLAERRVTDLTLAPGEAVSVGGEMISGYAASHLSLLGPTDLDLEETGVSVTGDLTSRVDGRTTSIVQLRPRK